MISFKQFLKEQLIEATVPLPAGIFVKVNPTTESILKLKERLAPLELAEDLHCTLIYSKTVADSVDIPMVDKHDRFNATTSQLDFWDGHDKEGYIVLKLKSDDLQRLHKRFRKKGIEPTFDDYNPHITIVHPVEDYSKYSGSVEILNSQLKKKPVSLEFYYGGYTIMDKKED